MAKNVQIPKAVDTKIYKTGQTRGADDDVIFQNRVSRNSTVLIPYKDYSLCKNNVSNYITTNTEFSNSDDKNLSKIFGF